MQSLFAILAEAENNAVHSPWEEALFIKLNKKTKAIPLAECMILRPNPEVILLVIHHAVMARCQKRYHFQPVLVKKKEAKSNHAA